MPSDELPPLPNGFVRVSGKSGSREGKWFVQLRMGWTDTRTAYEHSAIKWIWGYHVGDVVAVRRAE